MGFSRRAVEDGVSAGLDISVRGRGPMSIGSTTTGFKVSCATASVERSGGLVSCSAVATTGWSGRLLSGALGSMGVFGGDS